MFILGIDFGFQNTFIVEPEFSEEKGFIFSPLKFRNSKEIRNHAFFLDRKILFHKNLNDDVSPQNYINNLHTYIQMCYSDRPSFALNQDQETKIYMDDDKEVVFVFKDDEGDVEVPIARVLEEFFSYLFKTVIRPFNNSGKEVFAVISYPYQYGKRHRELIRSAAKKAGFAYIKLLSEQIAGILGVYNVEKFKVKKKRKFVVCNLDNANLDFCYMEFENGKFDIVNREIVSEKAGIDVDEELAAIYREMFRERNYAASSKYEQEIRGLAQETKRFFYKKQKKTWMKEFMGVEFYMDSDTFEELICGSFFDILEETGGLLNTKIDYRKLDALIVGGSNANFENFCEKLENIFNHKIIKSEQNNLVYAKGASLWALKSFTTNARDLFLNILDESIPKNLKNSLGIIIGIKDLDYHINKVIVPRGKMIPYKSPKKIKLRFGNDTLKIVFTEGEHILPKYNRVFFELELKDFDVPSYVDVVKIEFEVNIDVHLNVQISLVVNGKKAVRYIKYIPIEIKVDKGDVEDVERDMKMEYRARIAQKIQKVESYYNSLFSINIKKKFQDRYDRVMAFKPYVKNDFFGGLKLKSVYEDLSKII